MPQPPAYNRSHNFGQGYPDQIDRVAINNEFDGAASSINAIRDNLALIQRDDGGLKENIVDADALATGLREGIVNEATQSASSYAASAEQSASDALASANAAQASHLATEAAANISDAKAQAALDNSLAASSAANAAVATANGIDAKAQTALDNASAAVTTANDAETTANDAAAQIAAALAQVSNGVTPHTHPWADVTNKPATATRWPKWSEVTEKPSAALRWPNWHEVGNKPEMAVRWPKWSEVTEKPASFGAPVVSINSLPTSDVGPVIVAEVSEVWVWVSTQYYTGYRSPLCGRPVDGHTKQPLASEIDATGGLLSKADYPQLWAYAQENQLITTQGSWHSAKGSHYFVNISTSQFRVPDLSSQFRRYSGESSGYPTLLGEQYADTVVKHSHGQATGYAKIGTPPLDPYAPNETTPVVLPDGYGGNASYNITEMTINSETAPKHVVFYPRIHI